MQESCNLRNQMADSTVGVVSVIYTEPYWKATKQSVEKLNLPTVYVDREGVGSLSKAFNRGFNRLMELNPDLKYVWMLSNVTFKSTVLPTLVKEMDRGWDGIHPSFYSDHPHTRPGAGTGTVECSFFEFTAPIVRAATFTNIPLDENMPYWGQDFDWGYQVRQNGGKIGINFDTFVKHEYIRFAVKKSPHWATKERQRRRKETNDSTKNALVAKYGEKWPWLLDAKNYQK
jgi:hypothetical protein